jgi:hypothetical protein
MKRLTVISIVGFLLIFAISCLEEKKDQTKSNTVRKIQTLINDSNYEGARLAAIDTLEPEVRLLFIPKISFIKKNSYTMTEKPEEL